METHFATNKTSNHCGVLNFDNFPNLIYGNVGKKISFTFKIAHKGIEIKLVLTCSLWSNKSQAEAVCRWPIASIIPPELRALHMQLCVSQGTGGPLAPARTPAREHQHTELGWGTKPGKIPHEPARNIFEILARAAWGWSSLESSGMCLAPKQWDDSLWVGWAPEPKDFPFSHTWQDQTVSDSQQQHLSSPHSSRFGEWRG